MNGTAKDEAPLDQEQHKRYRRLVGKIQWLSHTRPDISYGAKELARSPQAPTQLDNKKVKRMIRCLEGTRYMRHNLRPKIQTQDKRTPLNIDTYTDANWALCETTQHHRICTVLLWSSTLWQQNTSSNSTFITAAQESLYISNFIKEAFEVRTNIRIHTDSSAAKPVAMREGTSKKAKHIELRHLFIQQLVESKIITTHKVKSEDNPPDLPTKFVGCDTLNRHMYMLACEATPQQFHTSEYSSQHRLLNNRRTVHTCLYYYITAGVVTIL